MSSLDEFLKEYTQVLSDADASFQTLARKFPEEVTCAVGCDDCCKVLFDLHLIEALSLKMALEHALSEEERDAALERAERGLDSVRSIREHLGLTSLMGPPDERLLKEMSKQRYDCPLLLRGMCVLYEFRPVTCRVYGVVTEVHGRGVACPRSGFNPGETYPTVKLDLLNKSLHDISRRLFSGLTGAGSPPPVMSVAEALLCPFDEEFFERALEGEE